jgi:acetyltransferase
VRVGRLSALFEPERVALVGATDREGSIGRAILENLRGFDGEVVAVNPNRETAFDEPCHPDLAAVPGTVDLAVVAVPARAVVEVVRQAGEAGVGAVVVVSAGFAERGARGRQRERELADVAAEYDLPVVGPNCVGVISTPVGLNVTFAAGDPPSGSVSLLSQSGAVIAAVLGRAGRTGVGFRHVVSLGNEAVLDEVDFLAAWADDPGTDVVLAYVEDVEDGREFVETAREVTTDTAVVALKAGRTAAGAAAAASHTGSIAGSDRAYEAGFAQGGVYRAHSLEEAFDVAAPLSGQPLPAGDAVAVVTNGGGPGVLAADAVADSWLDLVEFGPDLRGSLSELLPPAASATNPLDVVGDADLDRFERALDLVLSADAVDGAVVCSVPTALFDVTDLAGVVGRLQQTHGLPVVGCLMGGLAADRAATVLADYGVPNYFDPARAVRGLAALAETARVRERTYGSPTDYPVDRERAREVLSTAVEREVDYLGVEAIDLLDAYGVPTSPGDTAESAAEAATIAESVGGPVAMKVVSPDVVHKSDVGGVAVGVDPGDAAATYREIHQRVRAHDPDARLLGVHVEAVVDTEGATETIVGATRDPQFGPLVLFGLGGIFVQVFEDTAVRVAPVSDREAREMTAEIRAAPMLRGARGRPPADLDALVEAIGRVSQLVTEVPAIAELDVNPLVAGPEGVTALDFRVRLDRSKLSTP